MTAARAIKEQIQQGRYASASEVVRDGLRALEDQEKLRSVKLEALRREIKRGADSGEGIPAKSVFAAAVCAALDVPAQRLQLHCTQLFLIFQRTQAVTHDFARTGVAPLLDLLFDERFEVISDDIARRHG